MSTVITEWKANTLLGIIINIPPKFESLSVHKSLDAMEISCIIKISLLITYFLLKEAVNLHQIRFNCAFTAWNKHLELFSIMSITLNIILGLYMNIQDFALSLMILYLLRFHYLMIFLAWNWELQRVQLCLFLLKHFYWDIMSLVFHDFLFRYVGLDC